jgi:hypothetical protein
MVCSLCNAKCFGWFIWSSHITGKNHAKKRNGMKWSYLSWWQQLKAGDSYYYYDHITGAWKTEPPAGGVMIRPIREHEYMGVTTPHNNHHQNQKYVGA